MAPRHEPVLLVTDLSVFRHLTSTDGRLAFYTSETAHKIPETPGCYAWFIPLWIYHDDLPKLMQVIRDLRCYDEPSEKDVTAKFTWQSVDLRVSRTEPIRTNPQVEDTWRRLLSEDRSKTALQRLLLEASLLMPPLYVGRTNCLRRRYTQHVEDPNGNFHSRFSRHARSVEFRLPVSDLLFACLCTDSSTTQDLDRVDDHELTTMIEHILMNACRPPFSIR